MQHPDAGVLLRLLLVAPLLEEWIVRAGLQEWLRQWMVRRTSVLAGKAGSADLQVHAVPVLVSAAAFSLLHIGSGFTSAVMVFVPGLALAGTYQATRDWRVCALVHGLFNAYALCFCSF
ncbi:JDVT-CTERM system glutamic-type intramembrane protease [Undibacterium sp.]|uniref:JDVT-CTERM system glutamic-type intramembrane protease MrtJ n=1 Tax=Undibacterium sp. TaxID=1914977 RepID=UPI00374D91D6